MVYIDCDGESPPLREPYALRALHTALHECAHAIGATFGFDTAPEWLSLSGFVEAPDDPDATRRYWERRPGWEADASSWRYAVGAWFPREYSSKSPQEDFADCVAHMCLGWDNIIEHENGRAKLRYVRRVLLRKSLVDTMAASAQWFLGRFRQGN
jgi:hypothetical protein